MAVYTISKPEETDVEALAAMHAKSWLDAYPSEEQGVSREFIEEYVAGFATEEGRAKRLGYVRESYENPNYYFRVAKDQSSVIVGFVDARKGEISELCGLYIDQSAYGSGLARQMAEPALRWLGLEQDIKLTVVAYNERAQAFYRKLGFEVIPGSDKIHNNTPLHVVDMVRKGDEQ